MLVLLVAIGLAFWLGIEIGRRLERGLKEVEQTAQEERVQRGGVKLHRLTVRR